jgi:flagellar motility protein MotE (MotC chaperone)
MTPKVGVLSAVCAVAVGALAFKGLDIAQAFAQQAEEHAAGPNAESELTAAAGEHDAPADPNAQPPAVANQCLSSIDGAAAEMGLSSQEILVLRSLQGRREELEAREAGIETREQAAAAAEARLGEQIAQLKAVETEVNGLLAQMSAKGDERMASLVKTYEAMKPKDAAKIFDGMEDKLLVDIAKSMKSATLASTMSLMTPKRAETLTRLLADLAKPPTSIDTLTKPAAP